MRAGALAALRAIEAAQRRPVLLLRDDGPDGRPAFRGVYIQLPEKGTAEEVRGLRLRQGGEGGAGTGTGGVATLNQEEEGSVAACTRSESGVGTLICSFAGASRPPRTRTARR